MTKPRIQRRALQLSSERPTVWIGKNGVTQEVANQIDGQLERTEIVKVRVLKTAFKGSNVKAIADSAARLTNSTLFDVRGHTFILIREKGE